MNIENCKSGLNPGDIMLCNVKEELTGTSNLCEIWPANDRFMNMLILGPVGCGKGSQLLSMISQDIQNPDWGVTVMEPRGDLALKAHLMAQYFGRKSIYFNPTYKDCPKFNPLAGRESDVAETISETFKLLNPDVPQIFLDQSDMLLRYAVKVLKRLDKYMGVDGKYSNLIWLNRLLHNSGGQGSELVNNYIKYGELASSESEASENKDIAQWFRNDYFPERSKVYENTSGVRSQVAKLVTNEYLKNVLNPDYDNGETDEIHFDEYLATGRVLCITTASTELRDLSKYLACFITSAFSTSVCHRYNNKDTTHPHSLYVNDFSRFATPGFVDVLALSRPSRVSSVLTAHSRAEIGIELGKDFVKQILTRVRNIVLYSGAAKKDIQYFSHQFGFIPNAKADSAASGEIAYSIVKNGSVQPMRAGIANCVSGDLERELDTMADEYNKVFKG